MGHYNRRTLPDWMYSGIRRKPQLDPTTMGPNFLFLLLSWWLDWHWSALDGHRHDITHCYGSRYVKRRGEEEKRKKKIPWKVAKRNGRRVSCFPNRPSPIRKEKGRSLLQFHGRSSCGSYDRWRSFESPIDVYSYSSVRERDSIRLGCLSLQLGGRYETLEYCTYKWPVVYTWAFMERRDREARALPALLTAGWRTEPRLLPPARLAGGDRLKSRLPLLRFLFFLIQYTFLSHLYIYIFILICINNGCSPSGVVWVFNILD